MAINLSRNTKVFVSNVTSGFTNNNTWEVQVLSDFNFSQATQQQTITLNESGATPSRGQRSFNTELSAADWKFGMYIRPFAVTAATATLSAGTVSGGVATITTTGAHNLRPGDVIDISGTGVSAYDNAVPIVVATAPTSTTFTIATTATVGVTAGTAIRAAEVSAMEKLLWNAVSSAGNLFTGVNAGWTPGTASSAAAFTNSNVHQLSPLNLIFQTDNVAYLVSNCAVNQAEISFAIDQIATVVWSGNGTTVTSINPSLLSGIAPAGTYLETVNAPFITNKLSTISIVNPKTSTSFNLPITGGTLTINNNIQYLTPSVLGVVNKPVTYFTGTRAITGNLNAYLRTGGGNDAEGLFNEILATGVNSTDNLYNISVNVGGASGPRINLALPFTMLQVPTVDVQDVISTTINFTAQGGSGTGVTSAYDISAANELTVTYYAA